MSLGKDIIPNTARSNVPAVLLSYQQEWITDTSPFKIMEKGRRTGVTWAEASDDVLIAAADKSAGGQNVYYIGTDKEMTEEYIDACAMWCKMFNRAANQIEEGLWDEDEDDKHIKTFTIRFPGSGHKIVALASRPRKLRGRQGVLVGDEAAFQDSLPELIKAALAFLIWGGKVRLISTHDGVSNAFNELIQNIRAGKRRGKIHRITFREAVEQGLCQRAFLRMNKDWSPEAQAEWVKGIYETYGDDSDEELDCIPSESGGTYLTRALIESRMSDKTPLFRYECRQGFEVLPEEVRKSETEDWLNSNLLPVLETLNSRKSYYGMDFGRTGDLSVFVPLLEGQNLVKRCPFAVELRNVPFMQQRQVLFYIVEKLPGFMAGDMDARGNGQFLAEVAMQKFGSDRIAQVMISESTYRDSMPKMKNAFEDGTLTDLPKDMGFLDDLRLIETIKGVPRIPEKRTTSEDGGKRHGDAAVAVMLAVSASGRDVVPMESQGLGRIRVGSSLNDYVEY